MEAASRGLPGKQENHISANSHSTEAIPCLYAVELLKFIGPHRKKRRAPTIYWQETETAALVTIIIGMDKRVISENPHSNAR